MFEHETSQILPNKYVLYVCVCSEREKEGHKISRPYSALHDRDGITMAGIKKTIINSKIAFKM